MLYNLCLFSTECHLFHFFIYFHLNNMFSVKCALKFKYQPMYNQLGYLKAHVLSSLLALFLSTSFHLSIQSSLLATFLTSV
jgi:hypothetical protein